MSLISPTYLNQGLLTLVAQTIPQPKSRHFHLFAIDAGPCPRPYSQTLKENSYIYQPNPIKGNKPISIGHSYSVIAALPEKNQTESPWVIPLSGERIPVESKAIDIGNKQLLNIWKISSSWAKELSVLVADSIYSQREFIGKQVKQPNLVIVTRVRSNRVFYRQFVPQITAAKKSGHPRWYGDKFDERGKGASKHNNLIRYTNKTIYKAPFSPRVGARQDALGSARRDLKDETTWHPPDEVYQSNFIIGLWTKINFIRTRDWGL